MAQDFLLDILKDAWIVIKYIYTKRMKHGCEKGYSAWLQPLCENYSISLVAPVQLQLSDFKFYFLLKNNQWLLKTYITIYRDVQLSYYCILWPEANFPMVYYPHFSTDWLPVDGV